MTEVGTAHLRSPEAGLLRAEGLSVDYPIGGGRVLSAVSRISLDLVKGQTMSLVGESGCGKSTLGLALIRLAPVSAGVLHFDGDDLGAMDPETLRQTRPRLGIIFQDPVGSLNPRHTVLDLVAEPLRTWRPADKTTHRALVIQMLERVGLNAQAVLHKRSHELSGGQCQRVSIARALVLQPELLICDEPVSALDVSIQAQVLNLLADLKADLNLTVLFISHDLAVVRTVSDRVAVMYLGRLCEVADDLDGLYLNPAHPYTAMLLASVPRPEAGRRPLRLKSVSEPPSPLDPPSGCRFHTRCPRARARCGAEEPQMRELAAGRFAACHFPLTEGEPA